MTRVDFVYNNAEAVLDEVHCPRFDVALQLLFKRPEEDGRGENADGDHEFKTRYFCSRFVGYYTGEKARVAVNELETYGAETRSRHAYLGQLAICNKYTQAAAGALAPLTSIVIGGIMFLSSVLGETTALPASHACFRTL